MASYPKYQQKNTRKKAKTQCSQPNDNKVNHPSLIKRPMPTRPNINLPPKPPPKKAHNAVLIEIHPPPQKEGNAKGKGRKSARPQIEGQPKGPRKCAPYTPEWTLDYTWIREGRAV